MKRREGFFARLGEKLDVPFERGKDDFSLLLSGGHTLEVCGRAKICEYTEQKISLRVKKRRLFIEGDGLLCREFGVEHMQIVGFVKTVRLEESDDEI